MLKRLFWLACCVAGLAISGCSGGSGEMRLVVTADWLNQSLTLLDYDKLVDGQSDGPSAVVSVGPAFFDSGVTHMLVGSPDVPPGGTLLVVDLESGDATEIEISDVPLGIAISPDGTRAYTANYGTQNESGSTMSVIDLTTLELIEEVTFGGRPEQVALSPDGTLGVINVAGGSGGVHVFETADVEGTMSPLVPTGNDPSDVTFFGDNTRVAVANSFGLDVALVDTSDPSAPFVIDNFAMEGGFPYGVTYMPSRNQILAPTGTGANLVIIDIEGDTLIPSDPVMLPGGNFPLGGAVDATDSFAFVPHVEDKKLSIIDLNTGAMRAVTWLDGAGPSYVAVLP